MSATSLVLRRDAPKRVMTFELRRRGRLTVLEALRVLGPALVELGLIGMVVAGAMGGESAAAITAVISGMVGAIVWGIAVIVAVSENNALNPAQRRYQVLAGRTRRKRAHADVEKTRLTTLRRRYNRYSVWVEREGTTIVVRIVKHMPLRWGVFIRWSAERQTGGFDSKTGEWLTGNVARWTIADPTPESVQSAAEAAQEMAEAMEEASFAEALKLHKLDALALAYQPPPAGGKTQEKLAEKL